MPDYDGRGDEPATAGDVALWVPRLLLSPLYVVSEYVLRRPLVWLIAETTGPRTFEELAEMFRFGPNDDILLVPTASVDVGFKPTVGVYGRWDDFLADDNQLRLDFRTWPTDLVRVTVADRLESEDDNHRLQLRGEYARRPDGVFYGVGVDNLESNQARYTYELLESMLSYEARPWRASTFHVFARLRDMDFEPFEACCDDPTLGNRLEAGTLRSRTGAPLGPPPGLGGYTLYTQGIRLILDTRRERPQSGSGVRFGLDAQQAIDVGDPLAMRWVQYGATASVFVDLTGANRVLTLGVLALATSSIEGAVPFTELPDLGGGGPLKGFIEGWVIGPSAAAVTLEYDWPIWIWLDGTLSAALGNAFGEDFDGFHVEAGRFSAGLGVSTVDERDQTFTVLLAFGTAPLRDGAHLDSVRFVIGGVRAF